MGTRSIIGKCCKKPRLVFPCDYPRLMIGQMGKGEEIFFMTSPKRGICLTNHHESYYGLQELECMKDFGGSLKLFNEH